MASSHNFMKSKSFSSHLNPDEDSSDEDDFTASWICWSCSRVFLYKSLLTKHKLHCTASYKRKQNVQAQRKKLLLKQIFALKKYKVGGPATCRTCNKQFSSKQQYELHRKEGRCMKKRFACVECRKKFTSLKEFRRHDCGVEKKNLPSVQNNSIKNGQLKAFTCKCCDSNFDAPESLKTHLLLSRTCAKIHHMCIKLEYKKQGPKTKLTARKSFPNSSLNANFSTPKKDISPHIPSIAPYIPSPIFGSGRKSSAPYIPSPIFGSGRKKFTPYIPSPISGSARKSLGKTSCKIEENHFCSLCEVSLSSLSDLKLHKEYHLQNSSKNETNQCPKCKEIFSNSYELSQHQTDFDHYVKTSETMSFTCACPFCDKSFFHIQNRNAHLRYHTEKTSSEIKEFVRKTTCGVCFRTFSTEVTKEKHIRLAHISSPLMKNIDFQSNSLQQQLRKTAAKNDSSKLVILDKVPGIVLQRLRDVPNVCPVCFRTYDSNAVRNCHFRLHVMGSSCECEICSLKFPVTNHMEAHIKNTHKKSAMYQCEKCGRNYFSRLAILQHVMKNHSEYPMTDLIIEKDPTTPEMNSMNTTESARKEFYCHLCNLKFSKLSGLKQHENSKTHIKLLQMQQVKKEKVRSLQLQFPPRAITPPVIDYSKPITCTECCQEFSNVHSFIPHRLSHFSEENEVVLSEDAYPYTCEICGKLLDNRQKIQVHLFWHLQDMQSSQTNKSFKAKKSLPSSRNSSPASIVSKQLSGNTIAKKSFKTSANSEVGNKSKSLFTCKNCYVNFASKHHYLLHMHQCRPSFQTSSTNSSPNRVQAFNCSKCDKVFDGKKTLLNHQQSCDLELAKKYCTACACLFSTTELYNEHKVLYCTHNFTARINKDVINKNLGVLKNAVKTNLSITACIQCCLIFSSVKMLYNHIKKNHKAVTAVNGSIGISDDDDDNESDQDISSPNKSNYEQNMSATKSPTTAENQETQFCKVTNVNTIDPDEFAMESGQGNYYVLDENDETAPMELSNSLEENSQENIAIEIAELRQNFSRLLSALVSDTELMQSLGFGQRLIDDVLVSVLEKMALTPVDNDDDSLTELDKLRYNIRTLLDVCIKDQIMEFISDSEITTDKIVVAALKMFGVDSE